MADTPLCLLLPGTLCDARLYGPMLQAWPSSRAPAARRVVDMHGLLGDTRAWWDLQLASLPEQFDAVGFSLGAVLALQLLNIAPQRVRRLVLVAGHAGAGQALHRERTRAQLALWQKEGPASVAAQFLEQASAHAAFDARVRQPVLDMACATPTAAFMAQCELNATRPDSLPCLAAWQGPLLLVSGALDPWCGADKQNLMRSVQPQAQWCELPGCGHYVPLEQPQALAQRIDAFLREPHPRQRPIP